MKHRNCQYLFPVVRKGYDPDEVVACFRDLTHTFIQREEMHTQLQSAYLREILQLKIAVDEGQLCIENLQRQIDGLTRKDPETSRQGAPESPDSIAKDGDD